MTDRPKEAQRAELHKTIWRIANDPRGSVDGWNFKSYVWGILFYRFISENLTAYLKWLEREARENDFDYAQLGDKDAEFGRKGTVDEEGFCILPSGLFANVCKRAAGDENLNETVAPAFSKIEGSAADSDSVDDLKGLFDDLDVNSAKLGDTVAKRNEKLVKRLDAIGDLNLAGEFAEDTIDALGDAYEYLMQMYASSIQAQRAAELETIINDENLKPDETHAFVDRAFREGSIPTTGTAITKILPPVSRFCGGGGHGEKEARVLGRLGEFFGRSEFFDRSFGLSAGGYSS